MFSQSILGAKFFVENAAKFKSLESVIDDLKTDKEYCEDSERLKEKIAEKIEKYAQEIADEIYEDVEGVRAILSRWVNGINEPDFDTFLRICEFLDETPESLLGERIKEDKK